MLHVIRYGQMQSYEPGVQMLHCHFPESVLTSIILFSLFIISVAGCSYTLSLFSKKMSCKHQ